MKEAMEEEKKEDGRREEGNAEQGVGSGSRQVRRIWWWRWRWVKL